MAKELRPQTAVGLLSGDGMLLFVRGMDCWWEVAGDCGRYEIDPASGLPIDSEKEIAIDENYRCLQRQELGNEIAVRNLD